MKFWFLFSFTAFALSHSALAAETKSLDERIKELEKQQAEILLKVNENENGVKSFLKSKISFGGFFETGLSHIDGSNMESQTTTPMHLFGINIAAEISESDRFVGQLQTASAYQLGDPHNTPPATATRGYTTFFALTLLAHAYYEHNYSQIFNLQAGLGYVPFGRAYQYKEPTLLKRRGSDAQMVQPATLTSVGIAFPNWMGIHIHGSKTVEDSTLGYNLYTFSPFTNVQTIGGGARVWYQYRDFATMGFSGQNGEQTDHSFQSIGTDLDIKIKDFGVTMEYAESRITGDGPDAPKSYYILPYYEFDDGKFIVFATADYYDNPAYANFADPYSRWDYGLGLNWLPKSNLRFRLAYISHDYDDTLDDPDNRDYYSVDMSGVISF